MTEFNGRDRSAGYNAGEARLDGYRVPPLETRNYVKQIYRYRKAKGPARRRAQKPSRLTHCAGKVAAAGD
jgi:hypothetical protein